MRYFTPEPSLAIVPRSSSVVDHRRYSTAGNLDIYRPKSQRIHYSYEKPLLDNTSSPIIYWRSPASNDVSKVTEIRSQSNGPSSSFVSYLPLTSRSYYSPSYLTSLEKEQYARASTPGIGIGRKANESQYEVDQFENLLKRTFGSGGSSRYSTYTSPYSSYYGPYSSSYYSSLPRYHSSRYYNDRPYYSDSYSYPYYYSHPYYSSYYSPSPYYSTDYYGYRDLGYYGSPYYPSRYTYSYTV